MTTAVGTTVFIVVTYNGHSFSRLEGELHPTPTRTLPNPLYKNHATGEIVPGQPELVDCFKVTDSLENLDFEDITTSTLSVQVAGGLCEFPLGRALVTLKRKMCSSAFAKGLTIDVDSRKGEKTFIVPAHAFEVEFSRVKGLDLLTTSMQEYFHNNNQLVQQADLLSTSNVSLAFIYQPKPSIDTIFSPVQSVQPCQGHIVMAKGNTATITVTAFQHFDLEAHVVKCYNVEGTLKIFSDLASTEKKDDTCAQGCDRPLVKTYNNATGEHLVVRSYAIHQLIIGDPTLSAPYTRGFTVELSGTGYISGSPARKVCIHFNDSSICFDLISTSLNCCLLWKLLKEEVD